VHECMYSCVAIAFSTENQSQLVTQPSYPYAMVRRTKADAEVTRNSLLDAAELLFQERGVSRTSLNDIAIAAGTSRGAIYWHFDDKADLFNAMMARATLPLEETLTCMGTRAPSLDEPLCALRGSMLEALSKTVTDAQVRRVFEVATLQVEYNDEMHAVRERHLQVRDNCINSIKEGLRSAASRQRLNLPMPVEGAALGLHVIVDGLIQNWLLNTQAFDLEVAGQRTIDAYLRGLGFTLSDALAPPARAAKPLKAGAGAKPPGPSGSPKPARSQKQIA
jgi:TetR/AcrR family transcriptional regulator, acrAB operon repressor